MPGSAVRGVDHIGLTVPDIDAAEKFLIDGLGAERLYQLLGADDPPLAGAAVEAVVALPPGATIDVVRMYRVGQGPGVELFQYTSPEQRPAARGCDFGWQHLAFYVDDLDRAVERCIAAGAQALAEPWSLMGPESGPGNRFCFIRAPFGALIELVSYPSPQVYEQQTPLRRWTPQLADRA